jgi:hypothetical protein
VLIVPSVVILALPAQVERAVFSTLPNPILVAVILTLPVLYEDSLLPLTPVTLLLSAPQYMLVPFVFKTCPLVPAP